MTIGGRVFKLVEQELGLVQLPLLAGLVHELAPSHRIWLVEDILLHSVSHSLLADVQFSSQEPHRPAWVLVDEVLQVVYHIDNQCVASTSVMFSFGAEILRQ